MISGIHITASELEFHEFSAKEIGLAKYCKSFKIKLDEIKSIAISPRLALDDESIFILVINKSNKIYPIPDHVMGTQGLKDFEKHFGLNSISNEWQKFEYDDHYGKNDKIIYPKEKYWTDLFENNWKLTIRRLYSWAQPKSFYGTLNKENIG
ncbi:hypothetical protein [uncultured Aquimarina sp.]|uniref:hypothetical protein n=1 Tax=uncultured Aquimarina sp. TaxID=575652 RepID=UPI00261F0E3A|nr:hypothetical protein [uncultured Aquimarina sp.]